MTTQQRNKHKGWAIGLTGTTTMDKYKQQFNEWVKRRNIPLVDSLPDVNLHKGQLVMFTNDYGVTFGPHEILGFAAEPTKAGGCVYFDHDSFWMPCNPSQLTPVE